MGKKKTKTFGDTEIGKYKFYRHKSPAFLKDVDIEKILVSKKISSGKKKCKYFIGFLYNDNKVKPLLVMLPKFSAYVKRYDGQTKLMYFLIENGDLLEKYNTIWDKASHIKKNLIANLPTIKKFSKPK